jgi:hypothetical protein
MLDDITLRAKQPQRSPTLQRIADARRVLSVHRDLASHPFLEPADRLAIRQARSIAWAVLAQVVEELVAVLDAAAGDPDAEDVTDAEDEGLSPLALASEADRAGCPVADAGEYATPEGVRQREFRGSLPHEDRELDDDDRGEFEDEPLFDQGACKRLSTMHGDGPGGGSLLDSDLGADGC